MGDWICEPDHDQDLCPRRRIVMSTSPKDQWSAAVRRDVEHGVADDPRRESEGVMEKHTPAVEEHSMETLLLQVAKRLASLEEQVVRLTQQVKDVADAINKLRKKL